MTNNKKEIGKIYEIKASEYLISNGYKIVDKNYEDFDSIYVKSDTNKPE